MLFIYFIFMTLIKHYDSPLDQFHVFHRSGQHVCATVIIKNNHMLMCNHEIVIDIMLSLLNSTGHIKYKSRSIDELPTYDDT